MALALRLRRTLASAAASTTSSSLLCPAASASFSRIFPPAPFVPRPWLLPAAAAGFRSTAAARRSAYEGVAEDGKVTTDYSNRNGVDYKHWLITMRFPDPKPSREEMIETYLRTLAKVVGSYEEAKRRMYAFSTTVYTGFQAVMTREMSEEFYGLPGVVNILPDGYAYPDRKEYGGDKYDNGVITPFRPYYYWGKSSRPDWTRKHPEQPSYQMKLQEQLFHATKLAEKPSTTRVILNDDDPMIKCVTEASKNIADAIKQLAPPPAPTIPPNLWNVMKEIPNFNRDDLAHYYAYLCENPVLANAFLELARNVQIVWVARYIKKHISD